MKAIIRAARGGLGGRRLQAVVIGLVVLACTAASVLAVGILVDSQSPFDRGFAAQHGADVAADMSLSAASSAQLAATSHVSGVTAVAGPFPETTAAAKFTIPGVSGAGRIQVHLVGRSSPNGPADDLTLKSGHWPTAPDQVVWSQAGPVSGGIRLGSTVTFPGSPGSPALTVVGFANSITNTADAWVLPSGITALSSTGSAPEAQMLYRFSSASTATAVNADVSALKAALPAGTVQGTASYLTVRTAEQSNVAIWAPFIIAFGIIALAMSVLIVANVVSGAVIAGTTRIGVLKAIGFTPAQVTGSYVLQVAVPALAGCVVGAVLGVLLAIPILSQNASVYGVGSLSIPLSVVVAVPLVILGLTAVGAMLPALRAGRMSATQAIATGRAPRAAHGYLAHRLLGKLRWVPRAATIGLAAPFSRPARTAVTAGAIMFGAVAVTFGVGLSATLNRVYVDLRLADTAPLRISPAPSGPVHVQPGKHKAVAGVIGSPSASPAEQQAIAAALTANPDIAHWVPETDATVGVARLSQQAQVTAFDGDANWTGYQMIKGSWYSSSGSVDVNTTFLADTGTSVGSTVTLTSGGRSETVRIAGEAFANNSSDPGVFMSGSDLARIDPGQAPTQYYAGVKPGTDPQAVANALDAKLDPSGPVLGAVAGIQVTPNDNGELIAVVALIALLTTLLIVVAGLGVLNTVVLQLRERVHDLGVFKSVGMTPRQAIAMVVCSVTLIGLLAGIVAVPLGVLVHNGVVPVMGHAAHTDLPAAVIAVYSWWQYVLLGLAGLVIAVVAALGPAGWAARTRTAFALRAE
ncbi:MAG: putative transport system permease protein [Streptosporangiaceae bacterium]|nr:putative transport system permease protein [Streptosporangiaceae bacterium]